MAVPARVFTIGLVGCAALALLGCDASGSGGTSAASSITRSANEPSAGSLTSSMHSSVHNASSVHISGQLSRNGVPFGVDLGVTRSGDAAGTISQRGTPLHVVAADGKIYLQVTPAFLREASMPASACATACGKWVEVTNGEASELTGDFSIQKLVTPLISAPKLTAAGKMTVNGQPAWVLQGGDGSTVAVSAAAQHYPLLARRGGSSREVVDFSQWNSVPAPKPPPASQLLHLNNG
jgi:hypothetical protein